MSLLIYTGRLSCPGFVGYREVDALDVSRATADIGLTFAPADATLKTWTNAKGRAKRAEAKRADAGEPDPERLERELAETFAAFALAYLVEMRMSYRRHRPDWDALLSHDVVTLCSYEATSARSHRRLLAEILVKLGATYKGER